MYQNDDQDESYGQYVDEDAGEGQAIPFVQIDDETEQFEVSAEAMAFLASLPRERQVKVISVAGPYRTGKSFVLNRYLGQMKGFEIGSTVESCTKGIWMWNKALYDEGDDESLTILVDTEGLHSSERSTDVDLKIFALTVLMSSSFIFNQMGPINEQSLSDLHLIVNLVKYLGHAAASDPSSVSGGSPITGPDFFWCLRDFYLDISENFESPNAYMEDCLKPALDITPEILKKN